LNKGQGHIQGGCINETNACDKRGDKDDKALF
jgi:hypothetical protein